MREIALANRRGVTLVDDADYERAAAHSWGLYTNRYAGRRPGRSGMIYLHRMLLDAPPGMYVDHIDGNGLNNQRANLRLCTASQNKGNQGQRRDAARSPYKGVFPSRNGRRWVAMIAHTYVGTFDTPEEAAIAYNAAAVERYGEFALLNHCQSVVSAEVRITALAS